MPAYSYSAIDPNGLKKKGLLSAQSERESRKLIKELNLTPINVSETNGNLSRISRVKTKDIVISTLVEKSQIWEWHRGQISPLRSK